MDLLPRVSPDFSSKKYWDNFFTKRTATFEWYGNYLELCGLLHRYIKSSDNILISGCGNSKLSEDLYTSGFMKITNIDISHMVINQMKSLYRSRSEMKWMEMDINQMTFDDSSFNVVLDKGTLDAMMSSEEGTDEIEKMFAQIHRVLKIGGRYLVITLAQDHVLQKLLDYFPSNNWLLRIHKVWVEGDDSEERYKKPRMPLFMFVLTKFVNMKQKIIEICLEDSEKPRRLENEIAAKELIKAQQYYSMLKNELNHNEVGVDVPIIELFTSDQVDEPRYKIGVIDVVQTDKPFGIFIIHPGREHDWLYTSKQGRTILASNAGYRRLLLVSLSRHHEYKVTNDDGGMKVIQAELSSRIMELAPANLSRNYKTPFLSSGLNGITDGRHNRVTFEHSSGRFSIEDFHAETDDVEYLCRRLVRENHSELKELSLLSAVASEMVLEKPFIPNVDARTGRMRGGRIHQYQQKKRSEIKDVDAEKCYYEHSQAIISYMSQIVVDAGDAKAALLFAGLSSNVGLIANAQHYFPHARISLVEDDDNFIQIAEKWCGIDTTKLHTIHRLSTKSFFKSPALEETSGYDGIIMEVYLDSENHLLTPLDIPQIRSKLSDKGVLLMTLVTPTDRDLSHNAAGRPDHWSDIQLKDGREAYNNMKREILEVLKANFTCVYLFWCRNTSRMVIICRVADIADDVMLVSHEAMKTINGATCVPTDRMIYLVNACIKLQ